MDGVLIDSERAWEGKELQLLENMFGAEFAKSLGETIIGTSITDTYERAVGLGISVSHEEFLRRYDETAKDVLSQSEITNGTNELIERLGSLNYKIGLVSSSRKNWIDQILLRLPFRDAFGVVISLTDTPRLKRKPHPDGYFEAMRVLDADPARSIVLEDSNPGIQSAKTSGAYVIGFRGNLVPGYEQTGADAYADTMSDVIALVEKFIQQ